MKNYVIHRNNDLFDMAFDSFFRPFYVDQKTAFMKTDIADDGANYLLEVEMPGFDKKDIVLDYENGYLTISAKKSANTGSEKDTYIRRERATSFSRSYYVGEVDETQIAAKYENGVLFVTIPKNKPEKTKHCITIQ